ncbi:holin [Xylanibacillus composti]|uniref:Holin n=1 Tax=Xylanibacillus composti TaxID=1572762 RepID=A0A8J4H6T2_9BACL|nr:holin [Xylanibacillus composti]MDT9723750.1 holin [Xylanibacillus composti]GIQ70782.1 hypothetical protein XYCOK13_36060 [Xylanibacillus composti]
MNKKRLRNYGLWAAVGALVIDVGIYAGFIPMSESEALNRFVISGLNVLVLAGIVSNPTKPDGKGFNL